MGAVLGLYWVLYPAINHFSWKQLVLFFVVDHKQIFSKFPFVLSMKALSGALLAKKTGAMHSEHPPDG